MKHEITSHPSSRSLASLDAQMESDQLKAVKIIGIKREFSSSHSVLVLATVVP